MSDIEYRRHVDRKAARFLRAVQYYGDKATMTEIRQRTGLTRDAANHRFRRLEELGLIEVSYADHGYGNREPPKVAHLTNSARREIERGLLAIIEKQEKSPEKAEDFEADLRKLREDINRLSRRLDSHISSRSSVETIEDELWDHEEFTYEWMETAEMYLLALRRVAEEKLGVSMDSYIDAVEADATVGDEGEEDVTLGE